jgi:GNAT superfamily N-acetyltransferase
VPRVPVTIRQASESDLAALGDFFAALSSRTRYLRFFAPVRPTAAMLRSLSGSTGGTASPRSTGYIDVLVAIWQGAVIGHAMAADAPGPSGTRRSDIGVVVADSWQGKGVGSVLVRALVARAQARGVTLLTMDVLPANSRVFDMIANHWPAANTSQNADCVTVGVPLPAGRPAPAAPAAWPAPATLPAPAALPGPAAPVAQPAIRHGDGLSSTRARVPAVA